MKLCIFGFLFAFSACFSFFALAQTTQEYSAVQNVSVDAAGHIKVETLTNIEPNNSYDWHIHPYWENRYVTEGRDNLANKGIASVSTNQRGQILTSDIKERTVQILVSTQRLTT